MCTFYFRGILQVKRLLNILWPLRVWRAELAISVTNMQFLFRILMPFKIQALQKLRFMAFSNQKFEQWLDNTYKQMQPWPNLNTPQ